MVRPWLKKGRGKCPGSASKPKKVLACMAVQRLASVPNMYLFEFQSLLRSLLLIVTLKAYCYKFDNGPNGQPQVRMAFLMADAASVTSVGAVIANAFEFIDNTSCVVTFDEDVFLSVWAENKL
jgi:hypothetical protein